MKVILYMAISADGFIAKSDGDSDWVSEADDNFEKYIRKAGALIVGKRTFDQYYGDIYPMRDALNVVLSRKTPREKTGSNVVHVSSTKDAISFLNKKNLKSVIVIGGGNVNASFMKDKYIDEIYLIIHPLLLGSGIRLFENISMELKLKLIDTSVLAEDLIRVHYLVIK